MNINWIPTNEIYGRLLQEAAAEKRQQIYLDELIKPWAAMMQMVGAQSDDPLAGPRAWNWLLPDQTAEIERLLTQLEAANAWAVGRDALKTAVSSFAPFADQMPLNHAEGWLMLADPARSSNFMRGYTGAIHFMQPMFVGQFWEITAENMTKLPGLLAHELHHLIRLRLFPWDMQNTNVADYIVLEGTAESFAAALFGEESVGHFITEFDDAEYKTAKQLIGAGLERTGFNVIRSYIFGDELAAQSGYEPLGGMPLYGGYHIGYQVVQAFLQQTGMSIQEATFVSADEIVSRSGFFD